MSNQPDDDDLDQLRRLFPHTEPEPALAPLDPKRGNFVPREGTGNTPPPASQDAAFAKGLFGGNWDGYTPDSAA